MGIGKGSGRGGPRANAGRRAHDGAVIVACITASLDQVSYDIITELGEGNDSLGLRRAMAELAGLRNELRNELRNLHRSGKVVTGAVGNAVRGTPPAPGVAKVVSKLRTPARVIAQEEE